LFLPGVNLEDGPGGSLPFLINITEAYNVGKLDERTIRNAVKPLFYTRMRLGLFDPPEINPYAALDPKVVVQSAEHREIALFAAMRSIVLLKHTGYLPLPPKLFNTIAVWKPADLFL